MPANLKERFEFAVENWAAGNGPGMVIDLLQPFAFHASIDIEASKQKGCDYGWIDIQFHLIGLDEEIDSGDGTMYLLDCLRDEFDQIEIKIGRPNGVNVSLWKAGVLIHETAHEQLAIAVLELVCLSWPGAAE